MNIKERIIYLLAKYEQNKNYESYCWKQTFIDDYNLAVV